MKCHEVGKEKRREKKNKEEGGKEERITVAWVDRLAKSTIES